MFDLRGRPSRQARRLFRGQHAFHQSIIELSGNQALIRLAANLFTHMRMIRGATIGEDDRVDRSIRDHMNIIQALEARDTERAEDLVRQHAPASPSTSPSTPTIWTERGWEETMAEAALKETGRDPGADGRLQPRHRCDEANGIDTIYGVPGIPITDLGRLAQAAGIRAVVAPRAERRLRRRDRGLPDQEARRLPHRVGTGFRTA